MAMCNDIFISFLERLCKLTDIGVFIDYFALVILIRLLAFPIAGVHDRRGGDVQYREYGVLLFVRANRRRETVSDGHCHRFGRHATRQSGRKSVGGIYSQRDCWKLYRLAVLQRFL